MTREEALAILKARKTLRCKGTPSSDVCEGRFSYVADKHRWIKTGKGCYDNPNGDSPYWLMEELLLMLELNLMRVA